MYPIPSSSALLEPPVGVIFFGEEGRTLDLKNGLGVKGKHVREFCNSILVGNVASTLAFMWGLVTHSELGVHAERSLTANDALAELLRWVQTVVRSYGLPLESTRKAWAMFRRVTKQAGKYISSCIHSNVMCVRPVC